MTLEKTYFQEDWLQQDIYKDWLVPNAHAKTKAYCKKCKKSFELSNMGIQAVKSHAAGKKHQSATKPVSCFFINGKELHAEPLGSEEKISTFFTKKQATIVSLIKSSLSTNAEIIWALKSTMSCYSNNSCAKLNDTFKKMFPDSKIAEDFTMSTSKVSYIVNHGLAPYFKTLLKEEITKSDCYIVSFDESLNDITQTCQMDLLVRYWDGNDKVKVRYWTSAFLGHSAASDLLTHFNENLSRFDLSKMYQVSMDGPSTNLKFLDDLNKHRKDNEMPQLINIGSCSLHVIHGAFKTAIESTAWNIKEILKGCWQILHDSPARRQDYETVTGATKYPLFFCGTRWVESKSVADRCIEIWPNICKLIEFWEKLPSLKQPKSKSLKSLLIEKFTDRTPLGSIIIRNSQVLNPNAMVVMTQEDAEKKYKSLLTHLISLKYVSPIFSDKAINQFADFFRESRVYQDIFHEFNRERDSLDDFYFKKFNLNKYKEFALTVKILLTLSHGQASVERGFSINATVLEQNLNEKSITARRLVKDHMLSNNLQPHSIEITSKMIISVKSAHERYRSYLNSIADTNKKEASQLAKKVVSDEIKDVETRRDQLKKTSEMLQFDFVKFVEEAEEKQDLGLISKANAMKRKANEKNKEIKKLELALCILEQKRKMLK
ncbi:uncharacterized protein LOC124806683 [Hydra vulgaris]|uniref:uncharacterized protein LOC124806683 n=1 Tax=Hydra vulgaris TaxID=6087 RepID=UPI001F5E6CAA|nr:uncharacterized protein LOC124806683 [Hydra vulgaris]